MRTRFFALLSGALLPLAFAPYDLPAMAIISLVLFLLILNKLKPAEAATVGYAFGLGYFGHGVYWVYFSIHHFGHAPLWLAVIIMLGMVAILALYMALLAYVLNRFFQNNLAVRYLLAFPSIWAGLEALRAVLFTGFPWLSLGFSQLDTWLSSWAPMFGVLGVSWLVALTSGGILYLIRGEKMACKLVAMGLLLASWLGGLLLHQIKWVEPAGKAVNVALLQGNVPQEIKWLRSFRQINLNIYMQMTKQQRDADLIVWPETAIPAFYHTVKNAFIPALKREAEDFQSDIVLGLPVMPEQTGDYYNGLYSVRHAEDFYLKRHLVPLGEYMPLKPLSTFILSFLSIPMSDFSSGGSEQALLQGAGYPFASSICYEDVFQQTSIDGLPEAAYLVNVSNDTWFGDTIAPYQHLQMARMRALESGRYLLRSTNTGLTAIVNQYGEITRQAPMFKRVALRGELIPLKGVTPFVQGGWWFIYVLIALVVVFGFLKRDRKEQ
ncbi:MAG: apolipoprotein N-acyltransferase [Cycloclasticus sp. symbiont of Bathymodiolus heckerae]|nr:MAG: apolipoprotein N-acyltransferase [Cycloclasticus sp. symbiont of Bathymodiolus heckerae]